MNEKKIVWASSVCRGFTFICRLIRPFDVCSIEPKIIPNCMREDRGLQKLGQSTICRQNCNQKKGKFCFRDRQTALTLMKISELMSHTAHSRFDRFLPKVPVSNKNPQKVYKFIKSLRNFHENQNPQQPQNVHILWKFPRWWQPCL